jgi:hypothetical protein
MQSFKIIKPIHILTPYVRYYWILEDGADVSVSERTLPTGCIQLVFHRGKRLLLVGKKESQPQAFICGQCLNFSDVMSAGKIEMITVVFQPYAARAILQLPLKFFYGELRHRIEVAITDELRNIVRQCARDMHEIFSKAVIPKAKYERHCDKCSLKEICMPTIAKNCTTVDTYLNKHLYT